ncbi:MAG: DNA-binding protein [Eubacteriales bacterium]|nr:DNA-binding protein [Eubacteriales bacterium]
MDYISVRDTAKKWDLSERRVQKLCEENRLSGVTRFGHIWMIPKDAQKPVDNRTRRARQEMKCRKKDGDCLE